MLYNVCLSPEACMHSCSMLAAVVLAGRHLKNYFHIKVWSILTIMALPVNAKLFIPVKTTLFVSVSEACLQPDTNNGARDKCNSLFMFYNLVIWINCTLLIYFENKMMDHICSGAFLYYTL